MSLESKIEALTAAVIGLTAMLEKTTVSVHTIPAATPAPAPQMPAVPAPVAQVQMPAPPAFTAPAAAPAVQMPAPPSFLPQSAPVAPAAPVSAAAPFADAAGLTAYLTASFQALGSEKGMHIQTVMNNLGCQTITDIKPEHYDALYQAVEQLKAA